MATTVQAALRKLLPSQLPPSLSTLPGNLYEVLSRYPQDGIGQRVYQTRWGAKGIEGSYWEVTRTKLKCEGKHGKAWGVLVWKGMQRCGFYPPTLPLTCSLIYRKTRERTGRKDSWRAEIQMGRWRVSSEAGIQTPTPAVVMISSTSLRPFRSIHCTSSL